MEGADEDFKKRKKSIVFTDSDKLNKLREADDLLKRLYKVGERMNELQKKAEEIQYEQRNSNEFQMQLRRGTEATDLDKGLCNVLEAVEFDRKQELTRLVNKTESFKRRMENGAILGGEHQELKDLNIGVFDLDKKVTLGFQEVSRLTTKTKKVEQRQRE